MCGPPTGGRRGRARLLSGILSALVVSGCQVTAEEIAQWKETERGPGKLRDTLKRSSVDPGLRGQALAALVELSMTAEAIAVLGTLPQPEIRRILHEAVPRLGALASGSGALDTATRAQREAKDGLFLFRPQAAAEDRQVIDDLLIAWTTSDLAGRLSLGGQGSEKILTTIGARAAPRLIELLQPGSPHLLVAARILGKIGDADSCARAAQVLAEREHKERVPAETTLRAFGLIGGEPAVAFLLAAADQGPKTVRAQALYALAQGTRPKSPAAELAAGLRLAGDAAAPSAVREAAFQLVERLGRAAVPGLVRLMADPSPVVRWRSVEAALAAGKADAVQAVLEALPVSVSYKKEDLDSFVVHDLALLGPAALAPLKRELKSSSWVARAVAVQALAQLGRAEDAGALEALAGDSTRLKVVPGAPTVGRAAQAAALELRAKR